jgi:hypothetical protein
MKYTGYLGVHVANVHARLLRLLCSVLADGRAPHEQGERGQSGRGRPRGRCCFPPSIETRKPPPRRARGSPDEMTKAGACLLIEDHESRPVHEGGLRVVVAANSFAPAGLRTQKAGAGLTRGLEPGSRAAWWSRAQRGRAEAHEAGPASAEKGRGSGFRVAAAPGRSGFRGKIPRPCIVCTAGRFSALGPLDDRWRARPELGAGALGPLMTGGAT